MQKNNTSCFLRREAFYNAFKMRWLARKREDVDAILGLHDGVFPLGTERAIAGHCGPTVRERLCSRASDVEHRFNCEHVTDFDERATFVVAEVVDGRFFVETTTDAVTAVVFDNAEAVFVGDVLDGAADVVPVCASFACSADAIFHAELGGIDEFAGNVRDLANAEHGGGITVVAGEDRRDVDVHDVAILEDGVCVRDAVADNFVDADAGVARVTVIAHAGGDALVLASVVADEFIDFERGNAGLAHFARSDQRFGSESAGIADQFDFFCGFYFDFSHC